MKGTLSDSVNKSPPDTFIGSKISSQVLRRTGKPEKTPSQPPQPQQQHLPQRQELQPHVLYHNDEVPKSHQQEEEHEEAQLKRCFLGSPSWVNPVSVKNPLQGLWKPTKKGVIQLGEFLEEISEPPPMWVDSDKNEAPKQRMYNINYQLKKHT